MTREIIIGILIAAFILTEWLDCRADRATSQTPTDTDNQPTHPTTHTTHSTYSMRSWTP